MQPPGRKAPGGRDVCRRKVELIETRRLEIKCDVSGLCYEIRR